MIVVYTIMNNKIWVYCMMDAVGHLCKETAVVIDRKAFFFYNDDTMQ